MKNIKYLFLLVFLFTLTACHKHEHLELTSDENGHYYACECGEKESHNHQIVNISEKVEPTCSTLGKTEGKKCSVCDYIIEEQKDIEMLEHTIVSIGEKVEPTCSTLGKTEGKKCSICNYIIEEQKDIPMLEHTYVLKNDENKHYYECSVCNNIKDEEEHNVVIISEKVEPTCSTLGKTEGKKCSVCNYIIEGQELAMKEHDLIDKKDQNPHYKECTQCGLKVEKKLNILFIGNSHTNYNSLILCFKHICESEGYEVSVTKVSYGNQNLSSYVYDGGSHFKYLEQAVKSQKFDYCFIQGGAKEPLSDTENFYSSARKLVSYIKSYKITPIFYTTWGYPVDYKSLMEELGCKDTLDMAKQVAAKYEYLSKELNVEISAAGTAMTKMFLKHPEDPGLVYVATDNSHASAFGTYLVALCHFAKIYNKSPIGISFKYNDYLKAKDITWHCDKLDPINEELQKDLEEIAHDAIFGESILIE